VAAYQQTEQGITAALARWAELKRSDLAQLNALLLQNKLQAIEP
jgi:hypothetical protein